MTNSNSKKSPWTGFVTVDDTALAVTDTGGDAPAVVYLNGAYSSQPAWRRVIAELGSGWRHITYDERARGKSRRSHDYSFEGTIRDLDAVLEARSVQRPLLVCWSFGAATAVHWAARNPSRVRGVVLVDGGFPHDWIDDAAKERTRQQFRKMRWALPLLAPFGMAARMSADQHAEINIEINEVFGALGAQYDQVTCPVRFVVATGASMGGTAEEMATMRASLDPVLARRPNIRVGATVPSNHVTVLRKDYRAVAEVVRETAAAAAKRNE
ncbi:alpha/beta fold hydrolase [Stackebrandtia nassauensis]|uniref:Hydrolase or acyltransferase (Alpha/beta hydrolase superfamily)-like protein n=1 Tax=Stackebrandtia nassauensis (strain DSM 44728 / CIP 108903 / NRRL B-16338 / NBRC 102104 / LLR-40K-21) TaxID=446470 RepID=D3Q1A4_STANL|nr:alpha/beta hydrolase [Stackebrandtia nassauensis]ADD45684.1 hydrolase or acyltransferase (alpha/beta hydrolase superfamily)-like protein [Stackebrandtia nassauensis DSM 44728]